MGDLLLTVWGLVVALCGVIVGGPGLTPAAVTVPVVVPCEHPPALVGRAPDQGITLPEGK